MAHASAPALPTSTALPRYFSSPLQTIREDFGTARLDHIFSSRDSLSGVYTIDDGGDVTATPLDPYSTDILNLREQVFSLEETHVFSPNLLNTARIGFSRAGYFFTGEPTPGTPAASVPGFLLGHPVGAVVVGGSAASNPQAQIGLAGSNNGSNLTIARNLFTYRGSRHADAGTPSVHVWRLVPALPIERNPRAQPVRAGDVHQPCRLSCREPLATFLYDPAPTRDELASLFGAWYAEDVDPPDAQAHAVAGLPRRILPPAGTKPTAAPPTTPSPNGVISTQPHIGNSIFTANNAKFLPQPRIGLAWSPFGSKTVIRAGFGMYNDLQDALGYRTDQNAPFNPTYSIAALPVAQLPIDPAPPCRPARSWCPAAFSRT